MFSNLIHAHTSQEIIEKLSSLISDRRKARIRFAVENRITGLDIAVEAPSCIYNALAVIRTAEAFGVDQFHLIESEMKNRQGNSTAGGAHKWVNIYQHTQLDKFFSLASKKGIKVLGATVSGGCSMEEIDVDGPVCLLFGNEHRGLSKEAISRCSQTFSIDMFGMVESFNIANAAAIATHCIQQRKRKSTPTECTPSQELIEKNIALFYLKTVGIKIAKPLFQR